MSIAAEKVKFASERFLLVRMTPARFIQPSLLSGSTYSQTFPYPIEKIERNGLILSKVTSLSGNDQWTYDETTGQLQVRLASAPNDTSNVLIVYYYLFYTGTVFRSIYEDPEDDTTTVREWQPRLINYPVIGQSFSNILQGVFTISETNIDIINSDKVFQNYLTENDSFYNKAVDIWMCISSIENIQKVFTGTITSLTLGQNTVSISVLDSFNKLIQPGYMGDTVGESIFRLESFPNMNPSDNDTPCPYISGIGSRYKTRAVPNTPSGAPTLYEIYEGTKAVCTDFNPSISTSNNREWGLCRSISPVANQSFGSIQASTTIGTSFHFARFSTLSNVHIGDTIKWDNGGSPFYGQIYYVGNFVYSSVTYNVAFSYEGAPFNGSSNVSSSKSIALIIDAPSETLNYLSPRYGRDYTVSATATSYGNQYISIDFTSNFEANFSGFSTLSPANQVVSYRITNNVQQSHADILEQILLAAGMNVESVSFDDAYTALPVLCRFHIPNYDESAPDTYLKYAQDVLASTLGYLKINSNFEVEYHLLSAPSSTESRDGTLMLDSESRCEIQYQDIATQIIGYNPHNDSGDAVDQANTPAASAESSKARWLNGLVNVNRLRHVLAEFSSRVQTHIDLKSLRSCTYSFSTATEDIDTELGDDLQIDNDIVLGGAGSQDVKVVSIEKSPSKISIKASDLKGL